MKNNSFYQNLIDVLEPKKNADHDWFLALLDSEKQKDYENNHIDAVMQMLRISRIREHKKAIDYSINCYYKDTNGMITDGDIDILNKITMNELKEYYNSIINDESIDYIAGDININLTNDSILTPKNDFLFMEKGSYDNFIIKY